MFWSDNLEKIYWECVGICDRWGFPPLISGIEPRYKRIIGEIEFALESYNLQHEFKILILEKLIIYIERCSKTHWREFDDKEWALDHEEDLSKNKAIIKLASSQMVCEINDFIEELNEQELDNINYQKIEPQNPSFDTSESELVITKINVPHKIVLLYELGIFQLLLEKNRKNSGNIKDLAKIIGYVIGEINTNYIYSFLSIPDLNPMISNYTNAAKDSPFTGPSIKKMKAILLDCSIEIEKDYPEKAQSRNIKHNKK